MAYDGYGGLSPISEIKKHLTLKLENIYSQIGTNNAKMEILTIVDRHFKYLYLHNEIIDYTFNVDAPQENENDLKSIFKGGPRTFWVNYSVRLKNSNDSIHDSITVYVNGISRMITNPLQLVKNLEGIQPASGGTISTDSITPFPDLTGVEKKF